MRTPIATLATTALIALCTLANSVITARALGVEGRGAIAGALAVVALASGLSQMGLGQAFVYDFRSKNLYGGRVVLRTVVSILVTCVVAVPVAYILVSRTGSVGRDTLVLVIAICVATSALNFVTVAATAQQSLKVHNFARSAPIVLIVAAMGAAWSVSGLGVQSALVIYLLASVAVFLASFFWLAHLFSSGDGLKAVEMRSWPSYLKFGLTYHGAAVVGLLISQFDRLFLTFTGATAELGLYAAAFGLSRFLNTFHNSLGTVLFSRLAGADGFEGEGTALTMSVFRLTFLPTLAIASALSVAAPTIVKFLLGDQFVRASVPFAVLCFEAAVGGGSWLLAQQFNAVGRPGLVLRRQVISLVPLLALVWFLPSHSQAVFLAALMLLSACVRLYITSRYYRVHVGVAVRVAPTRKDVAWVRSALSSGGRMVHSRIKE